MKVYRVYGYPGGSRSIRAIHYHGALLSVFASSAKEALEIVGNNIWLSDTYTVGILEFYERNKNGSLLSCGCRVHGSPVFDHGFGKRKVNALLKEHNCPKTILV